MGDYVRSRCWQALSGVSIYVMMSVLYSGPPCSWELSVMDDQHALLPRWIIITTLVGLGLLLTQAILSSRFPPPLPVSSATSAAPPLTQATASATAAPLSTSPASIWPPPTPTPITDLATLVSESDVVVHGKVVGTNGAMHSSLSSIAVLDWFKKPAQVLTNTAVVWMPHPWGGEFTTPPLFWNRRGEEVILFLGLRGTNPWDDSPAYELTGAPQGATSIYHIKAGRISYAGILQYQGWAVADFEKAIRAVLPRPELGQVSSPGW